MGLSRIGNRKMLTAWSILRVKLPRKGEKGFTLAELLIVLTVISILSAVVMYNLNQMYSRPAEYAYETDQQTIQQVVALFLYDSHIGPGSSWGNGTAGHHYPTADGKATAYDLTELLAAAGNNGSYFDDGANGAIWMGLLANSPEDGTSGNDSPNSAHPQSNEGGPYLNEVSQSASVNNGNGSPSGTYTWVICRNGKVYGMYWDRFVWKEGCNGSYP